MTPTSNVNISELTERALDYAIDAALGFPKIDVSNFDQLSLDQMYGTAEKFDIEFNAKYWSREDFLDAFNNWNANLHHRSSDTEWVSRLISSEYISVTIGDWDVNQTPIVQNWKARSLKDEIDNNAHVYGETKDLAALRCFVASKLGFEIEVPTDLLPVPSPAAVSSPKPKF